LTGVMADVLVVVGTLLAFLALFGLLRGVERL
jgi:multisubunit Na+/H+ antiporter MnhG subunit